MGKYRTKAEKEADRQEAAPMYGGCADAVWIAMVTNKARGYMDAAQIEQFEDLMEQRVAQDLSPTGFIASGERESVRQCISDVLGYQWTALNDWA